MLKRGLKTGIIVTLFAILFLSAVFTYINFSSTDEANEVELNFRTISKGIYSGQKNPGHYIITDDFEWQSIWETINKKISPKPSLPEINFESEIVIAVFTGEKEEDYSIEIKKILEKENSIEIYMEETLLENLEEGDKTQAYHAVKLEKLDKEIIFINYRG